MALLISADPRHGYQAPIGQQIIANAVSVIAFEKFGEGEWFSFGLSHGFGPLARV